MTFKKLGSSVKMPCSDLGSPPGSFTLTEGKEYDRRGGVPGMGAMPREGRGCLRVIPRGTNGTCVTQDCRSQVWGRGSGEVASAETSNGSLRLLRWPTPHGRQGRSPSE